jgi:hypothetical protein
VLSGEFQVVNQHLLRDLTELGLWNEDIKNAIIANNGSIQNIEVGFSYILGIWGGGERGRLLSLKFSSRRVEFMLHCTDTIHTDSKQY